MRPSHHDEDLPSSPRKALLESDLDRDPIEQFRAWMRDAIANGTREPHRMTLATATPEAAPSARVVLLRGVDAQGFVFFTHYRSRKGREIETNPCVAMVFHWPDVSRQVRVEGVASRLLPTESDAYFDGRSVGSRLGAMVSPQSEVVANREVLHRAVVDLARQVRRDRAALRRPEHWGGYRVRPQSIEFWQGGHNRLHDRLRYRRDPALGFVLERLAP